MKSIYLAFQIILLAVASFLLLKSNIIIAILVLLIALEKFIPLYKQFKGKKVVEEVIKDAK